MTAAVFDLDNTIIRGSSLFHFGAALMRRGDLPLRRLIAFTFAELRFVLCRSESAVIRERIVEASLEFVQGRRQSELLDLCRLEAPGILARHAVPEVITELRHHQAAGRRTILITATPVELALAIGTQLGFTDVVGTRSQVVNDRYTGTLSGPVMHGDAKRKALTSLLTPEARDQAFAYSDSSSDLPMLTMVRHPIVVNADRRLRSVASVRRWRVIETVRSTGSLPHVRVDVV